MPSASDVDARLQRLEDDVARLQAGLARQSRYAPASHETAGWTGPEFAPVPPAPAADDAWDLQGRFECEYDQNAGEGPSGYVMRPLASILGGDSYPTVNWSGFLQLDTGWVRQDAANKLAVGDVETNTGLRRVRLRVAGNVSEHTGYVVDLDFAASGHPSFRDVMLTFDDVGPTEKLYFGYFVQPFGFDALTSGRELLFLERSLPFAFAPFRQVGVAASGAAHNGRGTWALSGFRFPTDSFGVFSGSNHGYAAAGRVTALPIDGGDSHGLVHVGFDYSLGDPGDSLVRYSIEPGFFVTDPGANGDGANGVPVFVDTGNIPTQFLNLLNVELGGGCGPFHAVSELRYALVNQIGGPPLAFYGATVGGSYVLTGESHAYDRELGVFRGVTPRRAFRLGDGCGAWELAAGWSFIDLDDENIQGGRLQTLVFGVNWYLNRHAKFQLNYIRAILDEEATGTSHANIVGLRTQVEF